MLESDVDDDYFTPITTTSLANIFTHSNRANQESENESLKYAPPKAHSAVKTEVGPKPSECIFACAIFGFEWIHNDYSSKGKIGFAIIKNTENNTHDIILYDSNKTTLSNTTVSSKLELTVKGNRHISYYDNLNKYWTLTDTEEKINNIVYLLKPLNVNFKYSPYSDKDMPGENEVDKVEINSVSDKGSDTDSLNKKTKKSILTRMAHMGQSVLPRNTVPTEDASDSSDDTKTPNNAKIIRAKPIKTVMKRINLEKLEPESQKTGTLNKIVTSQTGTLMNAFPMHTCSNSLLMPMDGAIITNSTMEKESDINMLITEQRVNNTELRINVNRLSDKIDLVIDRIKDNSTSTSTSFQNEILQKLLSEYENKIKMYEKIINLNEVGTDRLLEVTKAPETSSNKYKDVDSYKDRISELEQVIVKQNKEINSLCEEIKTYEDKLNIATTSNQINREMLKNNADCASDIETKLKIIMNDTFRTISLNFDDSQSYRGDKIKSIIATIIRKVTVDLLSGKSEIS